MDTPWTKERLAALRPVVERVLRVLETGDLQECDAVIGDLQLHLQIHDVDLDHLLKRWEQGRQATGVYSAACRREVIETLARSHPCCTALLSLQGARDKTLTVSDWQEICNRLLDHRTDFNQRQPS